MDSVDFIHAIHDYPSISLGRPDIYVWRTDCGRIGLAGKQLPLNP